MKNVSCGIFWNIAPLYSRALWYELNNSEKIDFTFYSGSKGFSGIRTINVLESGNRGEEGRLKWFFLKNLVVRGILIYQVGIVRRCIFSRHDVYVLPGEMHTVSNWLAAIVCKIRNKPVIFWGHGLYGNESALKKFFRLAYYRLSEFHFVYGNRSRELMISSGFNPEKIITVYNSLDHSYHSELYKKRNAQDLEKIKEDLFPSGYGLPVILYIGRLTPEKKIHYLIEAVNRCSKRGNIYNCLIIGNGIEAAKLKNQVAASGLDKHFVFYGANYDEKENAGFIMLSECTVSPGNVGLTAIHSLSLGTPVITHNNFFNQGPEVEAVIHNKTGLLFEENNVESLSRCIDDMVNNRKKQIMEKHCLEEIEQRWNPKRQSEIIGDSVLRLKGSLPDF